MALSKIAKNRLTGAAKLVGAIATSRVYSDVASKVVASGAIGPAGNLLVLTAGVVVHTVAFFVAADGIMQAIDGDEKFGKRY